MENNQIAVLEEQTTTLEEKVENYQVSNQANYEGLAVVLKDVKTLQKNIKDTFDPIVEAAHKTHKEATSKRKLHLDPVIKVEGMIKEKLIAYTTEQDRLARIEQEKLDRQARAEEDRKKKALDDRIEKAKADGKVDKVEELEEKKDNVEVTAPVVAPKVAAVGGLTYKTSWYAEVTDKNLIPIDYLMADMVLLNAQAKVMKDNIKIPGVAFKSKKVAASR